MRCFKIVVPRLELVLKPLDRHALRLALLVLREDGGGLRGSLACESPLQKVVVVRPEGRAVCRPAARGVGETLEQDARRLARFPLSACVGGDLVRVLRGGVRVVAHGCACALEILCRGAGGCAETRVRLPVAEPFSQQRTLGGDDVEVIAPLFSDLFADLHEPAGHPTRLDDLLVRAVGGFLLLQVGVVSAARARLCPCRLLPRGVCGLLLRVLRGLWPPADVGGAHTVAHIVLLRPRAQHRRQIVPPVAPQAAGDTPKADATATIVTRALDSQVLVPEKTLQPATHELVLELVVV
mmetsp:Transcript_10120/g.27543  ORF Transcript_10120/g.27543 Transcript_10120/m.27543 type:complete len:296 (-) Transcript_10120:108-995(-)